MKLIGHIIGKDFRRLRFPLAAWIAVSGAKFALGFHLALSDAPSDDAFSGIGDLIDLLAAVDMLLAFLIAALLLREDPVVDDNSFWKTRPISGGRLLAAKLLGLTLLVGAPPLLASLPWWRFCGLEGEALGFAMLDVVVRQALLVGIALVAAALTDTLTRLLTWSIVGTVIFVVAAWIVQVANGSFFNVPELAARSLLGGVVVVVAMAAVVANQFLTAQWRRSLLLFGAGMSLALGTMAFSDYEAFVRVFGWTQPKAEWHAEKAGALRLEGQPASVRTEGAEGMKVAFITSRYMVRNIPADLMLGSGEGYQQWRWESGPTVRTWGKVFGTGRTEPVAKLLVVGEPVLDEPSEREHAARRLRQEAEMNGWFTRNREPQAGADFERATMTSRIRPSVAARIVEIPPAYEAQVNLSLFRPEIVAQLPLRPTRWFSDHNYGLRIRRAETVKYREELRGLGLHLVESVPAAYTRSLLRAAWEDDWKRADEPGLYWFNRSLGHLIGGWGTQRNVFVRLGGVELRRSYSSQDVPKVFRDQRWVAWPGWLEGASLAVIAPVEEARFRREVRQDRFIATRPQKRN